MKRYPACGRLIEKAAIIFYNPYAQQNQREEKNQIVTAQFLERIWETVTEDSGCRKQREHCFGNERQFSMDEAYWAQGLFGSGSHSTLINGCVTNEPFLIQHHLPGCCTFTCISFRTTTYKKNTSEINQCSWDKKKFLVNSIPICIWLILKYKKIKNFKVKIYIWQMMLVGFLVLLNPYLGWRF